MYTVTPHGYCIASLFLLTDTPQKGYINLALTKGESMRYGKPASKLIDFPGEYDVSDKSVVCFDAGGYLHYQIMDESGSIVIIQDPALLEKETLGDVAVWLCTDQKAKDAIERDELEGEIIVMEGFAYEAENF